MIDRLVQHPNRYKLTNVSGDIYDLTPQPGVVTAEGDDINKANLLPDDVATALGLTGNPQVKDALGKLNSDIAGIDVLYTKIRDIPDTEGIMSVSLDLSDIDPKDWREVLVMGSVSTTTGYQGSALVRINNDSGGSSYSFVYSGGGNPSDINSLLALYAGAGSLQSWFRFSLRFMQVSANNYYVDTGEFFNVANPSTASVSPGRISKYKTTISEITSLNFNLDRSSPQVAFYLKDCSLWGIRR